MTRHATIALLVAALALSACGDDAAEPAATAAPTTAAAPATATAPAPEPEPERLDAAALAGELSAVCRAADARLVRLNDQLTGADLSDADARADAAGVLRRAAEVVRRAHADMLALPAAPRAARQAAPFLGEMGRWPSLNERAADAIEANDSAAWSDARREIESARAARRAAARTLGATACAGRAG